MSEAHCDVATNEKEFLTFFLQYREKLKNFMYIHS